MQNLQIFSPKYGLPMAGITAITAFIDPLPVRRSLEESEEKVTKLKKDRYDMDLKI